jgi:hypothetical protein
VGITFDPKTLDQVDHGLTWLAKRVRATQADGDDRTAHHIDFASNREEFENAVNSLPARAIYPARLRPGGQK